MGKAGSTSNSCTYDIEGIFSALYLIRDEFQEVHLDYFYRKSIRLLREMNFVSLETTRTFLI